MTLEGDLEGTVTNVTQIASHFVCMYVAPTSEPLTSRRKKMPRGCIIGLIAKAVAALFNPLETKAENVTYG